MTVGISRLVNIVVFACYAIITKLIVELMCSLDTIIMYRMIVIIYDVPYILCSVLYVMHLLVQVWLCNSGATLCLVRSTCLVCSFRGALF